MTLQVFRFVQDNLKWGERILLIAASNIDEAKWFLPDWIDGAVYEHEPIKGLTYDGDAGIIEHFYWEE